MLPSGFASVYHRHLPWRKSTAPTDGLTEGETEGDSDADGDIEAEGETDADGETEIEGETDGLKDTDGDNDGEGLGDKDDIAGSITSPAATFSAKVEKADQIRSVEEATAIA